MRFVRFCCTIVVMINTTINKTSHIHDSVKKLFMSQCFPKKKNINNFDNLTFIKMRTD